ncbi:MAG: RNA-binding S4 domain-containing protein [Pseudomonadota bacterium]
MSEKGVGDAAIRVDKWLFHARFFRSRGLAAALIEGGRLRVNGGRTIKPGARVRVGDVLTFPQAGTIRVVRILALGVRRGPAAEAQRLFSEVAPPESRNSESRYPDKAYPDSGSPSSREARPARGSDGKVP